VRLGADDLDGTRSLFVACGEDDVDLDENGRAAGNESFIGQEGERAGRVRADNDLFVCPVCVPETGANRVARQVGISRGGMGDPRLEQGVVPHPGDTDGIGSTPTTRRDGGERGDERVSCRKPTCDGGAILHQTRFDGREEEIALFAGELVVGIEGGKRGKGGVEGSLIGDEVGAGIAAENEGRRESGGGRRVGIDAIPETGDVVEGGEIGFRGTVFAGNRVYHCRIDGAGKQPFDGGAELSDFLADGGAFEVAILDTGLQIVRGVGDGGDLRGEGGAVCLKGGEGIRATQNEWSCAERGVDKCPVREDRVGCGEIVSGTIDRHIGYAPSSGMAGSSNAGEGTGIGIYDNITIIALAHRNCHVSLLSLRVGIHSVSVRVHS